MKVKDGADFATNTYEVRIGGALANDYYVYTITGAQLELIYGDLDGDNEVALADVGIMVSYIVGTTTITDAKLIAQADTYKDGEKNLADIGAIVSKNAGTIASLPVMPE